MSSYTDQHKILLFHFKQQRSHKPLVASKLSKDGLNFVSGHDHGKALGFPRPYDLAQVTHFTVKDMAIEEQKRGERLVLR